MLPAAPVVDRAQVDEAGAFRVYIGLGVLV